jgi:hypothetical protein
VRANATDGNDENTEDGDNELEVRIPLTIELDKEYAADLVYRTFQGAVSRANTAASSPILPRTASTLSETSQPQISRSGLLKRHATTDTSASVPGGQKQEKK